MALPALAMTRVGTLMAGRMLRTSNSYHSRIIAAAVAGLADRRWICAYHRRKLSSAAAVGAITVQVCAGAPAAQDRIGDLVDVSLIEALRVTGTGAQPRIPAQQDERLDPPGMRRREHQGRRAARRVPQTTARWQPVSSRIARMSSTCSSMAGAAPPGTGSDRPAPLVSYTMSRLNDASRRRNRASDGSIHA